MKKTIGIDEWMAELKRIQPDTCPCKKQLTAEQYELVKAARENGYYWASIVESLHKLFGLKMTVKTLRARMVSK